MDRLRELLEASLLRARSALEGGPQLDAKTEAAAAAQCIAELDHELDEGARRLRASLRLDEE